MDTERSPIVILVRDSFKKIERQFSLFSDFPKRENNRLNHWNHFRKQKEGVDTSPLGILCCLQVEIEQEISILDWDSGLELRKTKVN